MITPPYTFEVWQAECKTILGDLSFIMDKMDSHFPREMYSIGISLNMPLAKSATLFTVKLLEKVGGMFRRQPPFILGRLAAFFVGETAQSDAELFVGMVEVFDSVKRGQI